MRKLTLVAAAVSSALAMSYAITARADITRSAPAAYAESELLVSNFQILGCNPNGTFTGCTSTIRWRRW